jgi:hypothetical protein
VSAAVTGRGFAEFRRSALRLVLHGFRGGEASLNGQALRVEEGVAEIENRAEDFELSIELEDRGRLLL